MLMPIVTVQAVGVLSGDRTSEEVRTTCGAASRAIFSATLVPYLCVASSSSDSLLSQWSLPSSSSSLILLKSPET